MNRIKRTVIWFLLLLKSLLKKYSYILILLAVPVLIYAMNLVSKQESGILTIMLYQENPKDEISSEIVKKLTDGSSVIRFVVGESEEQVIESVIEKEVDAAWIFDKKMSEKLEEYAASGKAKKTLIRVVELEDNVILQLAREKLYGALYPWISYSIYENFILSSFVETDIIPEDRDAWREAYDRYNRKDDIFVFSFPGNDEEVIDFEEVNYLITPLRGMLVMVIVLSSFAAQMYFLSDRAKGVFVWLPKSSKYLISYGYQYAAMVPVCIVVYTALYLSGLFTKCGIELLAMFLFTIMIAAFSNIIRKVCRNIKTLGAVIPIMIIVMVSLSQIFFETNLWRPIQMVLPTYYYMSAVHNMTFIPKMLIYCAAALLIDGITYVLFEKRKI